MFVYLFICLFNVHAVAILLQGRRGDTGDYGNIGEPGPKVSPSLLRHKDFYSLLVLVWHENKKNKKKKSIQKKFNWIVLYVSPPRAILGSKERRECGDSTALMYDQTVDDICSAFVTLLLHISIVNESSSCRVTEALKD